MTPTNPPDAPLSAEALLHQLQTLLTQAGVSPDVAASPAASPALPPRRTMRAMEAAWGVAATRQGRLLEDLLYDTSAWELFERLRPRRKGLPRVQELCRCEPLLHVLRESGELAVRERLLTARNDAIRGISGGDRGLSEAARQQAIQQADDTYFASVSALAGEYRSYYQKLRRAVGTIVPLAVGPRIRSRPLLVPPLMSALFGICHGGDHRPLLPASGEGTESPTQPHSPGRHGVRLTAAPDAIPLLDAWTWDIAAIAVSAFFVRTSGNDPAASFPLLIDDYFDWRGVDPRKRSSELRREIDARIRLLCSDRLVFDMATELWLPDPETGRRQKTAIATRGSFLLRESSLYRPTPWQSEVENEPLYGHLITLGNWARPFLDARAMIGVFPRRLAEYDLRRQWWERCIGWYLTFQMHNQGAKMTFTPQPKGERTVLHVTPQHALKMRTVLENSRVPWSEMALANPGKVIKNWIEALETLRADGVIESYTCLDGAADGADLPTRSRLSTMLEYRYHFVPGRDLKEHLQRKHARHNKA